MTTTPRATLIYPNKITTITAVNYDIKTTFIKVFFEKYLIALLGLFSS